MLNQFQNLKLKTFQNKKKIKIIVFFLFSFLFPLTPLFSYNDTDTHPDLTVEIVKLYNLQSQKNKLTSEETELIRQGSILEDTAPRWINHFYNPETGKGWTADNLKGVSQKNMQTVSDWFLSSEKPVSSLNWAHNQELQNRYSLYQGNHTFQKAVYDYVKGNKEEGLKSLGFLLHLIEDASVPDHTRDDTHADISNIKDNADEGSPYEDWSENYTKNNTLTIAETLNNQNKKYYKCGSFDECLINLASYSHYNFFSEDTIFEYTMPKIFREELIFSDSKLVIKHYFDNQRNILVKSINKLNNNKIENSIYSLDDSLIMSSYFSHLSSEAVLTGAGIIETFFNEVYKAKNDPQYLESLKFEEKQMTLEKSAFLPLISLLGDKIISPVGEYFRTISVYNDLKSLSYEVKQKIIEEANKLKNLAENTISDIKSFFQNNIFNQLAGLYFQEKSNETNLSTSDIDKKIADLFALNQKNNNPLSANVSDDNSSFAKSTEGRQNSKELNNLTAFTDTMTKPKDIGNSPVVLNANSLKSASLTLLEPSKELNHKTNLSSASQNYTPGFGGGGAISASNGNSNSKFSISNFQTTNQENGNQNSNPASSTESAALANQNSAVSSNGEPSNQTEEDKTPPNAPIITSPSDLNQTFTSQNIEFKGTAEANSVLKAEYIFSEATTTATTSVSNASIWSLPLALNEGTTTIDFYAIDAGKNVSSSTRAEIFIDSLAPQITDFKILECEASIVEDGCLIATTTVNLIWIVENANDLNYFELSYGSEILAISSTSTTLTLKDGENYNFSLRTRDKYGNWSEASTMSLEINTKPIVINEVAWAGTDIETPNDEWLELYNRTDKEINLDKFVLYAVDFKPNIKLQGKISPKAYFLLERGDDDVLDIKADLIYGNKGSDFALNNNGEKLYLAYKSGNSATTTIDYILGCSFSGSWCGGSNLFYLTMERYNSDENIWGTNLSFIQNGNNAKGSLVKGTPRARNSLNYLLATTSQIQSNTVLKKENNPYLIYNTVSVQKGVTLKIEPGVVIKIKDGPNIALDVYGRFEAEGSENDNIVFTSFRDDSYLGDLNNDGVLTSPRVGDWSGVYLRDTSSSIISFAKFKYGGRGGGFVCCYGMLRVENATSTILNSEFEYSYSYGLELINSKAFVKDNIFRNNNNSSAFLYASGIFEAGSFSSPKILNNILENNYIGLSVHGGNEAEIENNIFNNNTSKAISVSGNDGIGSFKNNSGILLGGVSDGIYVSNLVIQKNATTTLYSNSLPYIFHNNPNIPIGSTLVIEPNLIKNTNDNRIEVFGSLITKGTSVSDVVFTSLYHPLESSWFGISANPGSRVLLSGATLKNGGNIFSWGAKEKEAAFYADRADITIENSLFTDNYKNGAFILNSESQIKNTEFKSNTKLNFDSRGLAYYNSVINLDNVSFTDNFLGLYANPDSSIGTIVEPIIFQGNASTSNIWLGL